MRIRIRTGPHTHSYIEYPDVVPASPKPRQVARKQCVNIGPETGQVVTCPTCRGGGVKLKTFGCKVFNVCTPSTRAPGIDCCRGCTRYSDVPMPVPEITVVRDLKDHYNCSIIEWRGKTLMASRLGFAGAQTFLSELDDDFQVMSGTTRDLGIKHARAFNGAEDPRFFVLRGQLHIGFTGYEAANKGHASQLVAALDDKLQVERVWAPQYAKRASWEKNWGPFEHDGTLHFVYTISPHVILRCDGEQATEFARTTHDFAWTGTALRGGAAPVKIGVEWYNWFHSFTTDKRGRVVYGLGLYTFAASPPFQLLRRCSSLLLTAGNPPLGSGKSVCFPCGAMLRGGKWIISYGQHDKECRVAVFDADAVEEVLR